MKKRSSQSSQGDPLLILFQRKRVRVWLPLFHPPCAWEVVLSRESPLFSEISQPACLLSLLPLAGPLMKRLKHGAVPVSSALPLTLEGSLGFISRTLGPRALPLAPGAPSQQGYGSSLGLSPSQHSLLWVFP